MQTNCKFWLFYIFVSFSNKYLYFSFFFISLRNTNEVIKVWGSTTEAERQSGFDNGNVSKCCNGKRKTHKGWCWMFLSDYEKLNGKIN